AARVLDSRDPDGAARRGGEPRRAPPGHRRGRQHVRADPEQPSLAAPREAQDRRRRGRPDRPRLRDGLPARDEKMRFANITRIVLVAFAATWAVIFGRWYLATRGFDVIPANIHIRKFPVWFVDENGNPLQASTDRPVPKGWRESISDL